MTGVSLVGDYASLTSLWAATLRAARGKRSRASVARTLLEIEGTLLRLSDALMAGTWTPGMATARVVHDGKRRTITVSPFEDRIVHQAVCAVIGPLLERGLVHHTFACRVGRGTHAALAQATTWARRHRYFVRLDVRKYFPSLDHAILLGMLARDIPSEATLALCARILAAGAAAPGEPPPRFHFAGDDLFTPWERPAGVPIGALTSQHFANRYLSPVDHRAKDRLRIRAYLRYMDDMLIFDDDPGRLISHGLAIEAACEQNRLRLHPWSLQPTREGVGFLGFRILPDCVRVKSTSVKRAIRRLALKRKAAEADPARWPDVSASVQATFAHWSFADTWRLKGVALQKSGLFAQQVEPEFAARPLRKGIEIKE